MSIQISIPAAIAAYLRQPEFERGHGYAGRMTDECALQTRLVAVTRQHEVEPEEAGNLVRLLSDLD